MSESDSANPKIESSPGNSQLLLLGGNLSQLGLGLLITVVLGRFLEPEHFGFFALLSTLFIVGRELNDMGTGSVAVREMVHSPASELKVISALLGWRRMISLALAVLCFGLALTADSTLESTTLMAASIVMGTLYLNAFYVVFQVRQAYIFPVCLSVLAQLAMLGLSLIVILTNAAGIIIAWLVLLRECLMTFGTRLLALRLLPEVPRPKSYGAEHRALFHKTLIFGLAYIFYYLSVNGGTFFIWFLGDNEEVGAYSAVFRLIYPLLTLSWVMMMPMLPVFSELSLNNSRGFASQVGANFRVLLGVGLVISVSGYVLAADAIEFLYGGKFLTGTYSSVESFRWLSLVCLMGGIAPALAIGLLAAGQERVLFILTAGALAANIVGNILLVPILGFTGAAIALTASEVVLVTGLLWAVSKAIGLSPLLKGLMPFAIPAVMLFFALSLLPASLFLRVIVGFLLTSIALVIVWTLPTARQMRKELALIGRSDVASKD